MVSAEGARVESREQHIWRALEQVMDPEIPVVSVVDLGVVRRIAVDGEDSVRVTMTPTFSGCPALDVMRREIGEQLERLGFDEVEVRVELSPPWTTDAISERGREKLRRFGLAPPPQHGGRIDLVLEQVRLCPNCGSDNTTVKNEFGSTLCRSIHYCSHCQEPFQAFKPL